jgi:hypothetical protein
MRGFSSGVRRAATMLWGIGAGLAASTAVLALAHAKVGYIFVYVTVSAALGTLAVATHRGNRRAEVITFFLLGSQVIGAAGAAWELAYGADNTAKASHLHDLGINYRLALAANLAFSTVAAIVFACVITRILRSRGEQT